MNTSESDSDGSHISATPPREPNLSPPPRKQQKQQQPPQYPITRPSSKHKTSNRRSSHSKPLKQSSPEPEKQIPEPSPTEIQFHSPDFSSLPFQIRRPSDLPRAISAVGSLDAVPAGFFSRAPSFSRIHKGSLVFESDDSPVIKSQVESSDGSEIHQVEVEPANPMKRKCPDSVWSDTGPVFQEPAKTTKRTNFNLIGGDLPPPLVKARKLRGEGEGNFVKLNLNGRKRKFVSKCRGQVKSRSGYAFKRRGKRKTKAENGAETEKIGEEEEFMEETMFQDNQNEEITVLKSFDDLVSTVRDDASDDNLARLLKFVYGFDSFRDGQLEAIRMVLEKRSTMLVLPTGAGKSLCYQIPSMIFPGITLVVSPLVSLMIDQLKQLPPFIRGGLLSSSQRPEEVTETLKSINQGTIKVLFVSPERFLNSNFLSLFSEGLSMSKVSLVVVDEAHCVSEWSHNFRTSYMRLKASFLRTKLNTECILAMTATATTTTLHAVMSALEIPSTNLIQKAQLRDNLQLSVSLSGTNRMKDLLMLMKSSPFNEVQSIIYCKFQFETDTISKYLRDNDIKAKSYHSGLPAKDRSRVQDSFCLNKIRVVVATVAFGMGLDKRDVGAVIHYSLPESLEEYVQEIGRAGRDGRLAYCHLFYDDNTYFKLRSLMHSDGVDEFAVSKFLSQVFSGDTNLHGKMCALVKESASRKLDMKEEVMLTLLTHLELGEKQYLRLLPQLDITCTLNFHKTPPGILAGRDNLVGAILKKSEIRQGQYVFDITVVANIIGVTATVVSNQLQNLKMRGEITYEMKDPAFCFKILEYPKDLSSLCVHLTTWLSEIENCKVRKFDTMSDAAISTLDICDKTLGCSGTQHTPCLQLKILDYFKGIYSCASSKMSQSSQFLRADIKVFLRSNGHAKFTPRAVARIMHGIASPAYPSTVWSKTHFWGRYMHIDFQVLIEVAKLELCNHAGKDTL